MNKQKQFNWTFWIMAALVWLGIQVWMGYRTVMPLQYSAFLTYLEQGKVAEVTVTESMING
jgi:cell division protease FtsH